MTSIKLEPPNNMHYWFSNMGSNFSVLDALLLQQSIEFLPSIHQGLLITCLLGQVCGGTTKTCRTLGHEESVWKPLLKSSYISLYTY